MPVPSPPRSSSAAPHTPSQTHKAAVPPPATSSLDLSKVGSWEMPLLPWNFVGWGLGLLCVGPLTGLVGFLIWDRCIVPQRGGPRPALLGHN